MLYKWQESYTFSNDELYTKLSDYRCPDPVHGPLDLELMSPIDIFELFFDDEVFGFVCQETNKQAMQKGAQRWGDVIVEELRCFLGILPLSGYNKLRAKCMWRSLQTCTLVSDAMRRSRLLDLLRNAHFCDNNNLDVADKCSKVIPLFYMVVTRFQQNAYLTNCVNVDDSMV